MWLWLSVVAKTHEHDYKWSKIITIITVGCSISHLPGSNNFKWITFSNPIYISVYYTVLDKQTIFVDILPDTFISYPYVQSHTVTSGVHLLSDTSAVNLL